MSRKGYERQKFCIWSWCFGRKQTGWDLGPFAAVLATGQMNPQTAKYRETTTDKLDFEGLPRAQGHCLQQFWEPGHAGVSPVKGRQSSGREHSPTISRKLDLRFTEHGLAPQSKTLFSLQPVPPNRRLPQASYPHPSEGRQNENYNYRS